MLLNMVKLCESGVVFTEEKREKAKKIKDYKPPTSNNILLTPLPDRFFYKVKVSIFVHTYQPYIPLRQC